jgi:hypothetical protein
MTTVKLTDKHMRVIENALEVYCRMRLGQFDTALREAFPALLEKDDHDDLEDAHILLRRIFFKDAGFIQRSPGASYGISSDKIGDGGIAYEIRQTFRQYLAVRDNNGLYEHMLRTYDDPLKVSEEPLPVIEGWDKTATIYINGEDINEQIHDSVKKKDWSKMWDIVDEYMKETGIHYTKGQVLEDEYHPGYYKLIMEKPYKRAK